MRQFASINIYRWILSGIFRNKASTAAAPQWKQHSNPSARFTNNVSRFVVLAACLFGLLQTVQAQYAEVPQRWLDRRVLPFDHHMQCNFDKDQIAKTIPILQKIAMDFARCNPPLPEKVYFELNSESEQRPTH